MLFWRPLKYGILHAPQTSQNLEASLEEPLKLLQYPYRGPCGIPSPPPSLHHHKSPRSPSTPKTETLNPTPKRFEFPRSPFISHKGQGAFSETVKINPDKTLMTKMLLHGYKPFRNFKTEPRENPSEPSKKPVNTM